MSNEHEHVNSLLSSLVSLDYDGNRMVARAQPGFRFSIFRGGGKPNSRQKSLTFFFEKSRTYFFSVVAKETMKFIYFVCFAVNQCFFKKKSDLQFSEIS